MQDEKYNTTLLITVLLFYFGACGGLWHIGYWSTFDINYLQYIGLTDIIKDFAFPFLTSCGVSIISFAFTTISSYHDRIDDPNSVLFGKGRETKTGIFLNKWVVLFVSMYYSGLLFFAIWGSDIKWYLLPFLISIPFATFLTNRGFLSKAVINPDIRASVINFLLILPIISFCFSKKQSIDIYNNKAYKSISAIQVRSDQSSTQAAKFLGLKYLGSATDKIFLANLDNTEITILNMDDISFITYKYFKP